MKNLYIALHFKIVIAALLKRQITVKKLINASYCYIAHMLKLKKSGAFPIAINFELTNECNLSCPFCRTLEGNIISRNPDNKVSIARGKMPLELYTHIIDQVKDHLLIAILYINGEPLLYKELDRVIKYSSDRHIATMIATNGMLLNEKNCTMILDAGLNFLKVAISGFTQEVYQIQHKKGNIERVKENLKTLSRLNNNRGRGLLVMVDYILYEYNKHELEAARLFCKELKFMFNVRVGISEGMEMYVKSPKKPTQLDGRLCDWPWKMMTIDWNGEIYPCCDYVVWNGSRPFARFKVGETDIAKLWNSERIGAYRNMHIKLGRRTDPICARCDRYGITFKY
jgi:radical SAM protein with 4Fe4S-binding SPASM domain